MKHVLSFVVIALVVVGICGLIHLYRVSVKNKKEMAQYAGKTIEVDKDLGKTLIVYYSLTGRTKAIAEIIAENLKGDLFELNTAEALPSGVNLHLAIKNQIKTKEYPALKALPDLSAYDTVFVGAPVWWYTVATPVLSFLNQIDFQGKKVVPFSTQGSNIGTFFEDFATAAKNANILLHASFNNMGKEYDQAVKAKIAEWINGL